jgi:metal-responsive CopG/Arc/MetJ family transcriptional regulator
MSTIKLNVSDDLLQQLNSAATAHDLNRAELIRRTLTNDLAPFSHLNYAKTCLQIQKVTNNKLSRTESEQLVNLVIKGMTAS